MTCTMYMTKITNDQTVRNNLSPIRLVLYQNAFTEFEKRTGNIKPTKKSCQWKLITIRRTWLLREKLQFSVF